VFVYIWETGVAGAPDTRRWPV